MPEVPPWSEFPMTICRDLFGFAKSSYSAIELRNVFYSNVATHQGSLLVYTDVSKEGENVSFAVSSPSQSVERKISPYASILMAELLAIKDAITIASQTQHNNITIISDTRNSIEAIFKFNNKHPLVNDILGTVYATNKLYCFCWIHSHVVIAEHNADDVMAKAAAQSATHTDISLTKNRIQKC